MKNLRIISGISLIIAGLVISSKSISMTGNVIGGSGNELGSILGIVLIIGGLLVCISAEGRRIRGEIGTLVGPPPNLQPRIYKQEEINEIQRDVNSRGVIRTYNLQPKERRREVYGEMAEVMRRVANGTRREGGYNIHVPHNVPGGLTNVPDTIVLADAKVLNNLKNQGKRGTERYVFDNQTSKILGIAYHPGGDATRLRWRKRFRYQDN